MQTKKFNEVNFIMPFEIKEICNQEIKSAICNDILRSLPNWFAIESSITEYTNDVKDMPFYVAFIKEDSIKKNFIKEKPIGFAAIKNHNLYTAEVYVMGVLEDYHRQGIGKALIYACEKYCITNKKEFLSVKTLDESHNDKNYAKTRRFYLEMGFKPLEVFPLLWGEDNPCLFLAKSIIL